MKSIPVCLTLLATPLCAESIISPQEFEAFASGKTLYFERNGMPYGAEQYSDDRGVIWTFLDGNCQHGDWYPEGDNICFWYEGQRQAQCWTFMDTDRGKAARIVGDLPENDLIVSGRNTEALTCAGPQVGVSYTPSIVEK